jgi:hypothetical protein
MIVYSLQPLDQTALLVTGGSIGVALASLVLVLVTLVRKGAGIGRTLLGAGVCLTIILPFLLAFAWSPGSIIVSGDRISFKSPLTSLDIPLDRISDVRAAGNEDLAGAYRTFGVGGLFGYFGEFRSTALGRFRMFSTSQKTSVLIVTGDGAIVASPASPDSFVAALRSRIADHRP